MSPDWWRDCRDGIEKCSSPTGDGNFVKVGDVFFPLSLRNVVPRQGTEIQSVCTVQIPCCIEKCSSPTGDGNSE